MDVGRAVLGLVLPERCLACGRGEELLCAECRRGLLVLRGTLCARCGCPTAWPVERCGECAGRRLAFASARSAVAYDAAARALVSAWKERGIARIAGLAAELVAETVPKPPVEALAFIPGEGDRVGWRGANPARELAGALAGRWGLPVVPLLARTRSARPQRGLCRGRAARQHPGCVPSPRGGAEGRRPGRRRLHDRSHRGRRGHRAAARRRADGPRRHLRPHRPWLTGPPAACISSSQPAGPGRHFGPAAPGQGGSTSTRFASRFEPGRSHSLRNCAREPARAGQAGSQVNPGPGHPDERRTT